jgi:hypothetical protein
MLYPLSYGRFCGVFAICWRFGALFERIQPDSTAFEAVLF